MIFSNWKCIRSQFVGSVLATCSSSPIRLIMIISWLIVRRRLKGRGWELRTFPLVRQISCSAYYNNTTDKILARHFSWENIGGQRRIISGLWIYSAWGLSLETLQCYEGCKECKVSVLCMISPFVWPGLNKDVLTHISPSHLKVSQHISLSFECSPRWFWPKCSPRFSEISSSCSSSIQVLDISRVNVIQKEKRMILWRHTTLTVSLIVTKVKADSLEDSSDNNRGLIMREIYRRFMRTCFGESWYLDMFCQDKINGNTSVLYRTYFHNEPKHRNHTFIRMKLGEGKNKYFNWKGFCVAFTKVDIMWLHILKVHMF